jgi:hypothetical protein
LNGDRAAATTASASTAASAAATTTSRGLTGSFLTGDGEAEDKD